MHILTAVTLVGGMLFLTMTLLPVLRGSRDKAASGAIMTATAASFNRVGAVSLVVLIVTGFTNAIFKGFGMGVFSASFWSATYAHTMGAKLIIALALAGLGLYHGGKSGKQVLAAMENAPDDPDTAGMRRKSSFTGRISLVLSLVAVLLGIVMSRGFLP